MPTETITIPSQYKRVVLNKTTGVSTTTIFGANSRRNIRTWMAGRVKPSTKWIPPTTGTWSEDKRDYCSGGLYVIETSSQKTTYSGQFDNGFASIFVWSPQPASNTTLLGLRTEASLRQQSESDCLNRIQSGKVNLAQAFAERRQTANLFVGTARRIAASINALRKGNVTGALRAVGSPSNRRTLSSRDIADQWLEIQYGWKPLLSDVYASVDKLRKKDEDVNRYMLTAKRRVSSNGGWTNEFTGNDCVRRIVETAEASLFTRLDYRVQHSVVNSMAQMGVLDPATLAWELLPWSFVVDWFLPIGNYLTAVNATRGLAFVGGSRSHRTVTSSDVTWRRAPGASSSFKEVRGVGKQTVKNISRSVYLSSPTPRFPVMKDPFSTAHVLNALALLRGSFRR